MTPFRTFRMTILEKYCSYFSGNKYTHTPFSATLEAPSTFIAKATTLTMTAPSHNSFPHPVAWSALFVCYLRSQSCIQTRDFEEKNGQLADWAEIFTKFDHKIGCVGLYWIRIYDCTHEAEIAKLSVFLLKVLSN